MNAIEQYKANRVYFQKITLMLKYTEKTESSSVPRWVMPTAHYFSLSSLSVVVISKKETKK